MATMDYDKLTPFNYVEDKWLGSMPNVESLSVGQSTVDRTSVDNGNVTAATGAVRLTYFTAIRDEGVTQCRTITGGTAAVTVTLARVGLYSVADNGDLTLVAATDNDTTLWTAASTRYTRAFALAQAYKLEKGKRYAIGILCVATTTPTMLGSNSMSAAENAEEPRLTANLTGQADLPASIPAGSLATIATRIYSVILP